MYTACGEAEFQFRVASFDFHYKSYQWLVISGPKAQLEDSGTTSSSGDDVFILTDNNGQVDCGSGVDKFQFKIWGRDT